MEILKYKFETENLGVKDGEVIELDPTVYEMQFACTVQSLGLFEDEYHKPLMNVVFSGEEGAESELGSPDCIRALACSTYIKIDNDKVIQNEATREEFKNLDIYKSCTSDLIFIGKLLQMATKAVTERIKQNTNVEGKPPIKN